MSSSAAIADCPALLTTPAATGIVRSAKAWRGLNGSRRAKPSCCRSPTSTSCSRSRRRRRRSPSTTNALSTPSCSVPQPTRCATLPPTRATSAPRSAPSPCCTPGGRPCSTIHTCTASSRVADCRPTRPNGSPAGPASSCRCGCCRAGFARCSSNGSGQRSRPASYASPARSPISPDGPGAAFAAGGLRFPGALADLAEPARFAACLGALRGAEWVVYSKRPFAGPEQVLGYLGRYTHRVAIANSRLTRLAGGEVSFSWKDYRHHGKTKVMTLAAGEFMRRFLLHTVPDGFHRIRHLGFLANGHRTAKLARCRALLAAPRPKPQPTESYRERHLRLTGHALDVCPECGGPMQQRGPLRPEPPPRPAFWCDTS